MRRVHDDRDIAIVGYAGRLPGAADVDGLWSLLRDNRSAIGWIAADRFPTLPYYHPSPDQSGRSYTFAAGLIDDVWAFDAQAFGMSPREAEQVDPQQRHLLEVTYDALSHAGIRPSTLAGTETGVYVGASSVDYGARFFSDPSAADVHMMTGNTLSIVSNRLSYALDLHGPSFTVDTACSSSMVALCLAAEAIRNGTVETAIVGSVNLLLSPFSFIGFSRASMLSPTGRCRPFDGAADGYVRAEGAIALVLRSVAAARKSRNRIRATIAGWGVGQDGRTNGLSLPSPDSQRRLLQKVYGEFGIDPGELAFVEAHGTGTKVGDPIEADALGKALGQQRSQPLPIGSVKSNIGHLEPASGLAGVLKSILALNRGSLPATLHQESPNPNIPFDELNLRVVAHNWPLPDRRGPLLAGINSFGFGGTNAHVVVQGEDRTVSVAGRRSETAPPPLLLSAHTADALAGLAAGYLKKWPSDRRLVNEFIRAAAHQRDALPHRAIVSGQSASQIRHHLECLARGDACPTLLSGQALGQRLPVAYVFSGNGSQWAGMGRTAWQANPAFRAALEDIDAQFSKREDWSLVELLFADDIAPRLRQATYAQPVLLALQMATVRCLEDLGVSPAATLGHSVGEIAAAWCAGGLSFEQAFDVVIARSRHQEAVRGAGAMAALLLDERDTRRLLSTSNLPGVGLAAVNSWRSVTVSGPADEIDQLLAIAAEHRIGARRLDLDYPFHSSLVDPVRAPLLRELDGLEPLGFRRQFVSSVTGRLADPEALRADYWWRNVRNPVQFAAGITCLLDQGVRLFAEIGPKPILSSYVRDMLRDANLRGAVIATAAESQDETQDDPLERAVARLLVAGADVDPIRFFGPPPVTAISLPAYPWRRTQFRIRPTPEAATVFGASAHPLLGSRPRADCSEWFSTVDPVLFPWLSDHRVAGVCVFPAAGYVEVLLAAAREVHPEGALELRELDIVRPLAFEGTVSFETTVRLSPETGAVEFLSRPRGADTDWALNAKAIVARSPVGEAPASDAVLHRGVVIPKAKVYEVSRGLGFDYGAAFQRVRHVGFPEPKRAIAILEPTDDLGLAQRVIDLTALDAAFHSLFASEEAGVADMPMKRMLPVRFGRIRAFGMAEKATRVVARTLHQSSSSILVDIELLNDDGKVVLLAQEVRLLEVPVKSAASLRSISYRTTTWSLRRAGRPSAIELQPAAQPPASAALAPCAEALSEALLLIEAGCLRAAWEAFRSRPGFDELPTGDGLPTGEGPSEQVSAEAAEEPREGWSSYLRSALFWHLVTKNLVKEQDGEPTIVETCTLPDVGSVVRSLLARHPTLAAEAAGLSRLGEIVGRLVAGDPGVDSELLSPHWQQLGVASGQVSLLRRAVFAEIMDVIRARQQGQLVRLLLIGAEHAVLMEDLLGREAGLEVVVTDLEPNHVDQARAVLGDGSPTIRCVAWSELEDWPAGTFDLAGAVDGLSEIAAVKGGIGRLAHLLRPQAPLISGEPAPCVFWDVVRGIRPQWWARSASSAFPIGALLTAREWVDELEAAGFTAISADPAFAQPAVGVVMRGVAGASFGTAAELPTARHPTFLWAGDETAYGDRLKDRLGRGAAGPAKEAEPDSPQGAIATDLVWVVDAEFRRGTWAAHLGDLLLRLAEHCRSPVAPRLWLVLDMSAVIDFDDPLDHPMWRSLTAAMRVVQNEYPSLEVRCLGFKGAASLEPVAEEMTAPTDEREVCYRFGERLVFRIERGIEAEIQDRAPPEPAERRLLARSGSNRGGLAWHAEARTEPGDDEVEIEVAATGLNFRDVMWTLGYLPEEALEGGYAGPALGMECAGTVSGLGPGVEGLAIGDRVVAFVSGGFASHVKAPAFAVTALPGEITFEAAATLPVAFLTAYYSLVHLGGLRRGETLLVHGGAGAVGLAALQIAHHCGAHVIATAGSEEKRALLRSLGADKVFNSRTLSFADEIRACTNGKGVDVVLNSLAGEAMVRSIGCLKPFGRFIELGKRDLYANTHVGLRPFRKNLSYFGVDLDQLIVEHRDLMQRLFGELLVLFASGKLKPLPHRVFDGERIADAFRLMQKSGHIGKIVVTPARHASADPRPLSRFPVDPEGVHVIVGGTSGFGLATAEWLIERGARHVALASRSGAPSAEATSKIEHMRLAGAEISVAAVDVTDAAALQRYLRSVAIDRPIKGIVHAAMVLDDRLIETLDRDAVDKVLPPKISGALNLEQSARDLALDYLLLYSSATTLLGNPGQFNYVAANGFVEGLAGESRKRGLPALAVAWGGIEDAGYLSRNMAKVASLKKRFAASLIDARSALDALDAAFDAEGRPLRACVAIARIDWSAPRRELAVTRAPMFAAVAPSAGARQPGDGAAVLEKLRMMPLEQASVMLLDIVVDEIARVLRLPTLEIDRNRALAEIGMDSLMMLELRVAVEESLQVELPLMSLANGTTPADVARRIAGLVTTSGQKETVPAPLAALSTLHVAAQASTMDTVGRQAAARAVLEKSRSLEGPL